MSQSETLSRDRLLRATLPENGLRILFVQATDAAKHAAQIHACLPSAGHVLGQALVGAALLGGLGKGEQRVSLQLEGRGPMRGLFTEGSADGSVRGWPRESLVDFPDLDSNELTHSIGAGYLSVLREMAGGDHYRAAVPLAHPRLDRNLEAYFDSSEQIPTAVGIWVEFGEERQIGAASGLLVQRLPGGNEEALETIRGRMREREKQGPLGEAGARFDPEFFAGLEEPEILESLPLVYRCGCTRERAVRGVIAAGEQEILDMIAKNEGAELTCEFCRRVYRFETKELMEIYDEAYPAKDA